MGILDSIVEWVATQIMNLLGLVAGSGLGALGCDMGAFLSDCIDCCLPLPFLPLVSALQILRALCGP